LGCRGVHVSCVPDRSRLATAKDAIRIYGGVGFTLYGPQTTDWLNRIRHISLANDVSGWEFVVEGEVQAFEQIERYKSRKVTERFTCEMLEQYCDALGIKLFQADFYGDHYLLTRIIPKVAVPSATMSLGEARSALYL
jgi:hypothetical protein